VTGKAKGRAACSPRSRLCLQLIQPAFVKTSCGFRGRQAEGRLVGFARFEFRFQMRLKDPLSRSAFEMVVMQIAARQNRVMSASPASGLSRIATAYGLD